MKSVILAAGKGKRLYPYTKEKPKCLIEINGKSLLSRQIDILNTVGIEDIFVVVGYLNRLVKKDKRYKIVYNKYFESTNSIYSLWLTKKYVYKNDFILLNGDLIFSKSIIIKLLKSPFKTASIINNAKSYEKNEMNVFIKENKITIFSKKIPSNLVNGQSLQITKFSSSDSVLLFDRIEKILSEGIKDKFPAHAYDEIFKKSAMYPIYYDNCDYWFEIDTLKDLERCKEYFNR
jgi:choline kinase